jgi:S-adenosylmethionine:tRNA ribosyltransferase-isomerase
MNMICVLCKLIFSLLFMAVNDIRIDDYDYDLPEHFIARYPLSQRDQSKLLVYDKGHIQTQVFPSIVDSLQSNDLLIANNTKVISARMYFRKATGALIEIFCLEPVEKSHQEAMCESQQSTWKCLVGGAKKWKGDEKLQCHFQIQQRDFTLYAEKVNQTEDAFIISFTWEEAHIQFSEILQAAGELPLPPYFNRKAEIEDYERYQTVFAEHEGSVAAPTAGLHFTENILEQLDAKGIKRREVTLHVGAGTFKPVSSASMQDHTMHSEAFSITTDLLRELLKQSGRIIVVGTTTMRTIESVYWLGVKLIKQQFSSSDALQVNQWDPYEIGDDISMAQSLSCLLEYAESNQLSTIHASTSIMIAPGYEFKICDGLVTNFHMPKSTLLLLVSAFIGEDWKRVYDYAKANEFRFLSYGDSSLLWRKQ